MIQQPARHAIIIGGGASGTLLAYQLLRNPASSFRVTIIERRPEIGRGIAYHTSNPNHLLNVRAANMSALPDQPDHFWRWLTNRQSDGTRADPFCFVPRRVYGDYIASLIRPFLENGETRRLSVMQGECVGVDEWHTGVTVTLSRGERIAGDFAILATGHEATSACAGCYADPWSDLSADGIDQDASVLILGTGLTMIDYVLSLLLSGHRGTIVAISRRGLLPRGHRRIEPLAIHADEIPFGASITQLLRWIRGRIVSHIRSGGDWRSVIDGLRSHTQRLWCLLPLSSKRRFLEHARAWWDVHRHRMAPDVEGRIDNALASGRLTVLAAKLVRVEQNITGALIHYRRRGDRNAATMQVAKIVDCTGIIKNPTQTTNRVLLGLFDSGLARVDPLGIGIEVGQDCAIINRHGTPSRRLFAIGPLTRAAFWEIVAVPDIRNQCAALAARLIHAHADVHTASIPQSMEARLGNLAAD